MTTIRSRRSSLIVVLWLFLRALTAHAESLGESQSFVTFNVNGGWSWFEGDRAIFDGATGQLVVSSVASHQGADGVRRAGDIDVVSYRLADGNLQRFTLSPQLQDDDHNSAALIVLPEGRYLASYSKHAGDNRVRYRITTEPHSISAWQPEESFVVAGPATYSNLLYLSRTNTLFNFYRDSGRGFDPNFLLMDLRTDRTFRYGGHLLTGPEENSGHRDRPYLRYASNGIDRIHFITTDHHPRNLVSNSLYHGLIVAERGRYWVGRSDGEQLGELSMQETSPHQASDFTPLMIGDAVSPINGLRMTRCWSTDIKLDAEGDPCVVFTARVDDQDTDHRFFYGQVTSGKWAVHELARAGGYLYAAENDYTGLAAIDPNNVNRVFISVNIDPQTNFRLPRYEIFEGITCDKGATWKWKSLTRDSTVDNIRPVAVGLPENRTALLWMRGTYSQYTSYETAIVGIPILPSADVSLRVSTVSEKQDAR